MIAAMLVSALVLLGGWAVTRFGTPLARDVAVRRGVLAPSGDQSAAVPLLGGVAIAAGVAVAAAAAAVAAAVLQAAGVEVSEALRWEFAAVVGLALAVALLGLWDDLRGLSPLSRLAVEVALAGAAYAAGLRVTATGIEPLDLALTVIWIVAVTNAFNLLDNMDGLSAGVAAIAALWFMVIAVVNGQLLVPVLAAAVAGCALGFLRHNRHPARVYMGDAGSLLLGFCLAVVGLKLRFAGPSHVTFFVPALVLGVALFDTALVVACRVAAGRSPFQGGKDHTSHRLAALGVPVPLVVRAIHAVALLCGWAGLVMSRVDTGTAFALMGLVAAVGVGAGVLLAHAPAGPMRAGDPPLEPSLPAAGRSTG